MVAKAAGVLVGALVTVVWFWLIGTRPVMETVVGLLLGLAGGVFVWHLVSRGLAGREGGES